MVFGLSFGKIRPAFVRHEFGRQYQAQGQAADPSVAATRKQRDSTCTESTLADALSSFR
jgi:hypothetical protein